MTTTLSLSPFTLGTMTFGSQVDEPTARSMLDRFLDAGQNSLDTANVYNAGASEAMLGRLLAGRRDRVFLASKVGLKVGDAPEDQGLSRAAIVKAIDASLRRLNTDYLDLYYLHQPDYQTPLEESLAALDQLVTSGKVRHVAVSNYAAWQVCRLLWLAEKNNWRPLVAVQPMYNLLARRIETELLPACGEFALAVIPYNPLAGGLLTGKHSLAAPPTAGTRFDRMPLYRDRYWNDANFAAVSELTRLAAAAGLSLPRLALRWLLDQKAIASVIIGASRLDHLAENLAALHDAPLAADTRAACDAVYQTLRGPAPTYNR